MIWRVVPCCILLVVLCACSDSQPALSLSQVAPRPTLLPTASCTPTVSSALRPPAMDRDPIEEKGGLADQFPACDQEGNGPWRQPAGQALESTPAKGILLPLYLAYGAFVPWALPPADLLITRPTALPESRRIVIEEIGLSLEVPWSWHRRDPEWAWAPPDPDGTSIGIRWSDLGDGWHPEAMFPPMSDVVVEGALDLGWAQAVVYAVRVPVPVAQSYMTVAHERHAVVLRPREGRAYDLYASAPGMEQLADLEVYYRYMLASVR